MPVAVPLPKWGKEVKKAMIDKDMSFEELAVVLGCSRPYLSNVINGREYSADIVSKVSRELGISELGMCDVLR